MSLATFLRVHSNCKILRKDFSRTDDWFNGWWKNGSTKLKRELKKKHKTKAKDFNTAIEEIKQRIYDKTLKLKRCKSRVKHTHSIPTKREPSRHDMSLRDFNQISIETDISETSQKHLKRDDFFVTSLRHLKYISKKMSFMWRRWKVSKTSLKYFWFFIKNARKWFRVISVGLLKYLIK